MSSFLQKERLMQRTNKKQKDFFIDVCIKGSNDLRKIIRTDEEIYNIYPGYSGYSKEYYIYLVLNELEKVGTTLMRIYEFISEGEADESRASRNILEAQLDETFLWLRKLTEILVELILFEKINSNDYFKHYILVYELRSLNNTISNAKSAYACTIQNYAKQVVDLKVEIDKLESQTVDCQKCWYLKIEARRDETLWKKGTTGEL